MVIKVIFARGRKIFNTNLKKVGYARHACHKNKREKRRFFHFYGERAAHTSLFFLVLYKNGRPRAKITLITMIKNLADFLANLSIMLL